MIWVLLGLLLFGLSGDAPVRATVEAVQDRVADSVSDGARRERADAVLQQFLDQLDATAEEFEEKEEAFLAAFRAPDTPRERLDALLGDVATLRAGVQERMLDMRFALRDELTPEEWAVVFPPE
jgi:hypothetical protein